MSRLATASVIAAKAVPGQASKQDFGTNREWCFVSLVGWEM